METVGGVNMVQGLGVKGGDKYCTVGYYSE